MDAKNEDAKKQSITFVSIHAPVMDANAYNTQSKSCTGFNPRARDGRELGR